MKTARSLGISTSTVISHMEAPLGRKVGNSLEVYSHL
jgi:thymidine phosphorylase